MSFSQQTPAEDVQERIDQILNAIDDNRQDWALAVGNIRVDRLESRLTEMRSRVAELGPEDEHLLTSWLDALDPMVGNQASTFEQLLVFKQAWDYLDLAVAYAAGGPAGLLADWAGGVVVDQAFNAAFGFLSLLQCYSGWLALQQELYPLGQLCWESVLDIPQGTPMENVSLGALYSDLPMVRMPLWGESNVKFNLFRKTQSFPVDYDLLVMVFSGPSEGTSEYATSICYGDRIVLLRHSDDNPFVGCTFHWLKIKKECFSQIPASPGEICFGFDRGFNDLYLWTAFQIADQFLMGPALYALQVVPSQGGTTTPFVFQAMYRDYLARMPLNDQLALHLNSSDYPMTTSGGNITQGILFSSAGISGLPRGQHAYFLDAVVNALTIRAPLEGSLNLNVVDEPPILSNGHVVTDESHTPFTYQFFVTYSDADGDPPDTDSTQVIVDGTTYAMTHSESDWASGVEFASANNFTFDERTHRYHFESTQADALLRFPYTGELLINSEYNAPITAAEYFLDTDPGPGNGVPVPVTADPEPVTLAAPDIGNLSLGSHRFCFRYFGNEVWSSPVCRSFLVVRRTLGEELASAECYWDTDPGLGAGVPIEFNDTTQVTLIEALSPVAVGFGQRRFYLRLRSTSGLWGAPVARVVLIERAAVAGAEFFIDDDPGIGNGIALTPDDGAFDEQEEWMTGFASVASLDQGQHEVAVRVRDVFSRWSQVKLDSFLVGAPFEIQLIAQADSAGDSIRLFWRSFPEAVGYRVYYDSLATGPFNSFFSVDSPDTQSVLPCVSGSGRRFYRVTAVLPVASQQLPSPSGETSAPSSLRQPRSSQRGE